MTRYSREKLAGGEELQMRAFIVTLRNTEAKKHLFILPEAQPGPHLSSQRFHISLPGELKEEKTELLLSKEYKVCQVYGREMEYWHIDRGDTV